jgi:hypothetical protein
MRTIAVFVVAIALSLLAHWRTSFSPHVIAAPLENVCCETKLLLDQNFTFLGKGRQSFAFVSSDGKTVLKFFNKNYFQMPWYTFLLSNTEAEKKKRDLRKKYFSEGYLIAEKYLPEQTGLLYVHYGSTKNLPKVCVKDQANRNFTIDLNHVTFILQRKGEPFFSSLEKLYETEGKSPFFAAIDQYLDLIRLRISLGIADGDHDIEHNYGLLDGKPFHLDPGRLYLRDFSDKNALAHEWWVGTHELRKWLKAKYPELNLEEKWNRSF